MNKLRNLIISVFAAACLFSGCSKTVDNDHEKTIKNIKSLFIINPTSVDKNRNEKWFDITTSSRQIEESEDEIFESENDINIHSPVFNPDYSSFKKSFSNRSAETSTEPDESEKTRITSYEEGQTRVFYDNYDKPFDSFFSKPRTFTCRKEGQYCYIWTCEDETDESIYLSDSEINAFAEKFDTIYKKETALCGPKYDGAESEFGNFVVNDKVSLIINDINENKANGFYYGYYSPGDMYINSGFAIEAIHLDSYAAKHDTNNLFSTIGHEFNHKLNFDNKTVKYGLKMDTWYTEMLSMLVEDFLYEDLQLTPLESSQTRLSLFYKGSFIYGFKNWTQIYHNIELQKYSNSYAFGAFLARNYGGADLIHEICTNEYVNEESVVKAVNKINGTKKSFDDLLKEFPATLINIYNENEKLPSLNKSTQSTIGNHIFKLNPINPKVFNLEDNFKVYSNNLKLIDYTNLDAYGFQFYAFDKPTKIRLWKEDFVLYAAY